MSCTLKNDPNPLYKRQMSSAEREIRVSPNKKFGVDNAMIDSMHVTPVLDRMFLYNKK